MDDSNPIGAAWAATDRLLVAHAFEVACTRLGLAYIGRPHLADSAAKGRSLVLVDLAAKQVATGPADVVVLLAAPVATRALLDALERGADAVLTLDDGLEDLEAALRSAVIGEAFLSASASRLLLRWHRTRHDRAPRPVDLTLSAREQDVLRAIMDGLTIKGTARRLGVAVKTVEAHRRRMFDRLGVRTQREALTLALSDPNLVRFPARSQP